MLRGPEIQRKPSGPPSRLHGGVIGTFLHEVGRTPSLASSGTKSGRFFRRMHSTSFRLGPKAMGLGPRRALSVPSVAKPVAVFLSKASRRPNRFGSRSECCNVLSNRPTGLSFRLVHRRDPNLDIPVDVCMEA